MTRLHDTRTAATLLGQRLRSARVARGLSLREAAPLFGVSAMALSKWERGKVRVISKHLRRAAEVYGRKLAWFFFVGERVELELSDVHYYREAL